MAVTIIDTPQPCQRWLPRLPAVEVVIRYITSTAPRSSKCVQDGEVKAIAAAGKQIGIVHEAWGDIKHAGRGGISSADGTRDGRYARKKMTELGAPQGACVYFAIDTDLSRAQINANALPYFNAIAASFADGYYTVGVYGPGAVCAAVVDGGLATYGWLSNAKGWAGYKAFLPRAALVQLTQTKILGLDVDPNVAQVPEWGQWTPGADDAAIMPIAGDPSLEPVPVTAPVTARLGAGEGEGGFNMTEIGGGLVSVAGVGGFARIKSIFKSKIAWLTGGLGATGAGTAASTDPTTVSAFSMLMHSPAFWLALLCVALAGVIIYYRYRDHGRGVE